MNYTWEIARIIIYLVLVMGIIYLLHYLYNRKIFSSRRGNYMEIMENLPLSSKKHLSLLKVNGEVLLLSIGEEDIRLLKKWNEDEFDKLQINQEEKTKDFATYLKSFLGKSRRDGDE